MYVIPDSSVLIADPWLRGQRTRVLLNFVGRTRSRIVLLPSVESEVSAHMRRVFAQQAASVESALRQAARHELQGLPEFAPEEITQATFAKWHRMFADSLAAVRVERPALDESILPEVVRRSTERVPPCDHAGKEMRDTIIWLSLLSYSQSLPADAEVAFLTLNTKDFASADGTELRIELANDVAQLTQAVTFFPSLDAFNKVHAERVAYLTVEWIREKLGGTLAIAELVDAYVRAVDADAFFRISSSEYEDYYQPGEVADVFSVGVELNDVYVWKTHPNELELGIEFTADVEAEVECGLIRRPTRHWHRTYDEDLDDDFPHSKSLTCVAELSGVVAGRIVDDEAIEVIDLEELERR